MTQLRILGHELACPTCGATIDSPPLVLDGGPVTCARCGWAGEADPELQVQWWTITIDDGKSGPRKTMTVEALRADIALRKDIASGGLLADATAADAAPKWLAELDGLRSVTFLSPAAADSQEER